MAIAALVLQGGENFQEMVKVKGDLACSSDFVNANTTGPVGTLPSGTPVFFVTITNICPSNCRISNLYLKCESFTSEIPISPNVFRRVGPNDCLVNDGLPIGIGNVVTFEYAHPHIFNLSVLSLRCLS
ncbi:TPD1 protein homolog 1-like [Neltuma alba]|uniref:TPD1 protein homolog 1-like n=1 Tax=Neltuma alba TaxID=207710 RepID=UPI0010A4B195|nr:TPD1 protein homolog 1-like [Prosopis alba]